jgi:hypothetical protein
MERQFHTKSFNRRSGKVERRFNLLPREAWLRDNHCVIGGGKVCHGSGGIAPLRAA